MKQKKLSLKEVHHDYSVDEIMADLKAQCSDVVNVVQMKSRKTDNDRTLNLYLIYFNSTCKVFDIKKTLRYCCDQKIVLEEYKKPKAYTGTQCHNCLRYGHIAKYCGNKYGCVKCSLSHSFGKCEKNIED